MFVSKENWSRIRSDIKMRWEMLTDNDLDSVDGDREDLIDRIQERYGVERPNAKAQLEEFEQQLDSKAA